MQLFWHDSSDSIKKIAIKFLFMWMQNFFVVTTMKNFKVVGVFLEQYQSLFFILISFENLEDGLFNVIVALSLLFVDCFFSKQTWCFVCYLWQLFFFSFNSQIFWLFTNGKSVLRFILPTCGGGFIGLCWCMGARVMAWFQNA